MPDEYKNRAERRRAERERHKRSEWNTDPEYFKRLPLDEYTPMPAQPMIPESSYEISTPEGIVRMWMTRTKDGKQGIDLQTQTPGQIAEVLSVCVQHGMLTPQHAADELREKYLKYFEMIAPDA